MSAARALSPKPRPIVMPQAMASTFLSAPPICAPTTSSLTYGRKVGPPSTATTASPSSGVLAATVAAAGRSRATSAAKVGPVSTATGRSGRVSPTTSLIRAPLPISMPLAQITGAPGISRRCMHSVRICCAGTANNITSPLASSRLAVGAIAGPRLTPGRYAVFSRCIARVSASSALRVHNATWWPRRAASTASAVPQAPAPNTPTFMLSLLHQGRPARHRRAASVP